MVVLSLLSAGPKNGVELINEIEALTRGWWRPSPGSIYPLLKDLEEEGLVKKSKDDKYELTTKASDQMEWSFGPPMARPRSVGEMLTELSSYVSYLEDLAKTDKSKLDPEMDELRELSARLAKLTKEK
jgi:DNA-binding PadR family transcriptional regulator